jgi:hypothetical protein
VRSRSKSTVVRLPLMISGGGGCGHRREPRPPCQLLLPRKLAEVIIQAEVVIVELRPPDPRRRRGGRCLVAGEKWSKMRSLRKGAVDEGCPLDSLKKAPLRKTPSCDFIVLGVGRVLLMTSQFCTVMNRWQSSLPTCL